MRERGPLAPSRQTPRGAPRHPAPAGGAPPRNWPRPTGAPATAENRWSGCCRSRGSSRHPGPGRGASLASAVHPRRLGPPRSEPLPGLETRVSRPVPPVTSSGALGRLPGPGYLPSTRATWGGRISGRQVRAVLEKAAGGLGPREPPGRTRHVPAPPPPPPKRRTNVTIPRLSEEDKRTF